MESALLLRAGQGPVSAGKRIRVSGDMFFSLSDEAEERVRKTRLLLVTALLLGQWRQPGEPRTIPNSFLHHKLTLSENGFWDSFRMSKQSFFDLLYIVRDTPIWQKCVANRPRQQVCCL